MFALSRLKVKGFRGFRTAEEFRFETPVISFFGENGSGKSSGLNAVEWCLFGGGCTGKQTGIRERVGWIVPNLHMETADVSVEVELTEGDETYVIHRSLAQPRKKASVEEGLELTLPDGTTLTGEEAEERLAALLQSSFRDFLTTVYQHQESIRAVLTQEPKDRNDAIDRLLGLSSQRNMLLAINEANCRAFQKEITERFADFEQSVQTALTTREGDLANLRRQAEESGLPRNRLTAKAACQEAQTVAESLAQFAEAAGLKATALEVPNQWTELAAFDRSAKKIISGMRGQVPGIQEQQDMLRNQKRLLTIKIGLETAKQRWDGLTVKVHALDKEHGSREELDTKIVDTATKLETEQERLRTTNGQAAILKEAIEFLDTADDVDAPCPVCSSEQHGLLDRLRQLWAEKLQALVTRITSKIEALKSEIKRLRSFVALYQKVDDEAKQLQQEQADLVAQVASVLNRKLTEEDDPLALVTSELKRLGRRLQELAQAIQERQERLDTVEQDLTRVRLVHDYLQQVRKKEVLEAIQGSAAFRKLETLRDEIAQLVEDSEAIKDAVAEMAREEGEAKLTMAAQNIDRYFRQLCRTTAVQQLKLTITTDKRAHRNVYAITDQDDRDLTPILSQGELNALALAIFLGLATAAKESATFGFLMLDDASQSLGTEHKKQLAQLLDQVARDRRVFVATMDAEFHRYLMEHITKAKTEYRFGNWTPARGPSITVSGSTKGNRKVVTSQR